MTQNESTEKHRDPRVVGQFGMGLKDALAVFDRRGVGVEIRSPHGEIRTARLPKAGFADLVTLHAIVGLPMDPNRVGTDVSLSSVTAEQVDIAKSFFLRFSGDTALKATRCGQVLSHPARGKPARVYVKGLLVAHEANFLFSYNITDINAPLRTPGTAVWFGGGKLAADLTLPKLRHRWAASGSGHAIGQGLSTAAARAVLWNTVTGAAEQARSEPEFFARLREAGVMVRLRFGEVNPGQVTGYAVALPGHLDGHGEPLWHGGGRLSGELTLPGCAAAGTQARGLVAIVPGRRAVVPERPRSLMRDGTRSSNMRPGNPPSPRNTSAAARSVIRLLRPTRPGRPLTRCMSQPRYSAAGCCEGRRRPMTAPPAHPMAAFPAGAAAGTGFALPPG